MITHGVDSRVAAAAQTPTGAMVIGNTSVDGAAIERFLRLVAHQDLLPSTRRTRPSAGIRRRVDRRQTHPRLIGKDERP